MSDIELAVIGGSGLYNMAGLTDVEELKIDTPFGAPSDDIVVGTLNGRRVAFLPRHAKGHRLNPSEVPYRANIYALKTLGVKYLIAVSACGSLKEEMAPKHIVIPDQLYDNTKGLRAMSFFEGGMVAHVGVADPFCPQMSAALTQAVAHVTDDYHEGGCFITIEGPRFSTKGESRLYRQWGMSIIGMTTSPEAYLAREAEMAYACMAHVTDYDVWHESEEPVTVEMVIKVVQHNTVVAQNAIARLVETMGDWEGEFASHSALRDAFLTNPNMIPAQKLEELAPLVSRYYE